MIVRPGRRRRKRRKSPAPTNAREAWTAAIAARGEGPQRFHFSAVREAAIEHAAVQNGMMEITVRFDAAFETAEAVGAPHEVTDHWTFTRAVKSSDPNWTLVATSGGSA